MTKETNTSPVKLFLKLLEKAKHSEKLHDPTAMALSSCDTEGNPTVRYVLFKGIKDGKLSFASNYTSRKGKGFDADPRVAVSFYWHNMYVQVRVEGRLTKFSEEESDEHWNSRSLDSQISAWLSLQSQPLNKSFSELKRSHSKQLLLLKKLKVEKLPRPDFWGGYWIHPHRFEFWYGNQYRLHERVVYFRKSIQSPKWTIQKLYP